MNQAPNILYILADDLGYGDLSCLNPESRIQTPHHDRLAGEGMIFSDAHSNSAVCTPTRYGILTGRYCWRSRLKSDVLWGWSEPLIEKDRPTVASFLRSQGYSTACIGKWHLGLGWHKFNSKPTPDGKMVEDPGVDYSQPLTAGPHTVGFDYSSIIPASLDMPPYVYIEDGKVTSSSFSFIEDSPWPEYWRGGPAASDFDHRECLHTFTRQAENYIANQARTGGGRPFFLYVPMPSPHAPHLPRKPFQGQSRAGNYGDFVVEHDWSVGRLLAALDKHGLAENTLVIVTSDNGAHRDAVKVDELFGHNSAHIYRGQKSDVWDGGHRIPFLVRWPEQIAAGSSCGQTVCLTDLMATVADLCEVVLPEGAGEDSISMLPYLREQTHTPQRTSTIHHSVDGQFAIRKGPWKLIDCAGSGGWSLPESQVPNEAPPRQLYHLDDDPGETVNLLDRHPATAAQLKKELDQARASPGQT